MNIFVHTPFYKNSKYIPHLLEHTIYGPIKDIDHFYDFYCESDAYTRWFSTMYCLPGLEDPKVIINRFDKDIDLDLLERERKVLNHELSNFDDKQYLYQKYARKYFDKKFDNNGVQDCSIEEIISYKNNYYRSSNYIMTDDLEQNILYLWSNYSSQVDKSLIDKPYKPTIVKNTIIWQDKQLYVCYDIKCRDRRDYVVYCVLRWALNDWILYQHHLNRHSYDYPDDYASFIYQDRCILYSPRDHILEMSHDYLQKDLQHLISFWSKRSTFIIVDALLQTNTYVDYEHLEIFLKKLGWKGIEDIIWDMRRL